MVSKQNYTLAVFTSFIMRITKHDLFSNTLFKQNDVMSEWLLLTFINALLTTEVAQQGPRVDEAHLERLSPDPDL